MTAAIAMADYTGPRRTTCATRFARRRNRSFASTRPSSRQAPRRRGIRRRWTRCSPPSSRSRARIQQSPCHLLRADRVPDRVPEGQLPGRVHDRGAQRPGSAEKVAAWSPSAGGWDRGAAAGRPAPGRLFNVGKTTPMAPAASAGIRRDQERGRGRIEAVVAAREDVRDLRHGRPVHEPGRSSRGPAPPQARGGIADQGRCHGLFAGSPAAAGAAGPRPGDRGTPPARRGGGQERCSTCSPRPPTRSSIGPAADSPSDLLEDDVPRRERLRWRRSCWASTCPSIRWATLPTSCRST